MTVMEGNSGSQVSDGQGIFPNSPLPNGLSQ